MTSLPVAVVTGAGGGIGGACAYALAAKNHVLCVDLSTDRAAAAAQAIRESGGESSSYAADASDPAFGESVAAKAAAIGPVGCAVHAVAHEEHVAAIDVSLDSIQRSLAMGPIAAFSTFRALARSATLTASPAFTVIGSLHETHAFADCLGYNAAHGALGQVVRTLANEWAPRRIRVNAVVPGWISTPGELRMYGAEHLERVGRALPFGRMGSVDEVAAMVAFVSSAAASYISGSFLTVDGGLAASLARLPQGTNGETSSPTGREERS